MPLLAPKKIEKYWSKQREQDWKAFHKWRKTYPCKYGKEILQLQLNLNAPFLGISPVHLDFTGQVHHVQQPLVGQTNHTKQIFLDIQNKQKQIMELFMNLNQKMSSMYNIQT